jgi:transcriptional regulator with XRE-family HTH domain
MLIAEAGASIRTARMEHDLGLREFARELGISPSEFSRVERGMVPRVPLGTIAAMATVVGLEPSLRLFPSGHPLRDRAHVRLLADFHARIAPDLRWATEVPLPMARDARAWDALVTGNGFRAGIEAETRLRDAQAVQRRATLKKRDSGVERVLLVLRNSRWNREAAKSAADVLLGSFPVPGDRALQALAAASDPGGDAVILI